MENLELAIQANAQEDNGKYRFRLFQAEAFRSDFLVDVAGMNISDYRKSPVVLFNHDKRDRLPIGRASNIRKDHEEGAVYADITFDQEDEFARQVEGKVKRGFLNMVSIGASVQDSKWDRNLSKVVFTKTKLYEVSIVAVGENTKALKIAASIMESHIGGAANSSFSETEGDATKSDLAPTPVSLKANPIRPLKVDLRRESSV